jgi:hypothetical protein
MLRLRRIILFALIACITALSLWWHFTAPSEYTLWEERADIQHALTCEQPAQQAMSDRLIIEGASYAVAVEPPGDGQQVFIDLEDNVLYLLKDNKVIKKYPVAEGKYKTPSPIGAWQIVSKRTDWGSGFGTRWLGLNVPWGVYGIHGTNKPDSVGWSSSHGCFRMQNKHVEELFDLVKVGTPVYVYGGPYGPFGTDLRPLNPGDRNSAVMEVQKRLKKLGYYNGSLDGIYGEGMKAALLKFKKDYGLPYTHTVDAVTYKTLNILKFD